MMDIFKFFSYYAYTSSAISKCAFVLILLFLCGVLKKRPNRFPPGPPWLPIVGNKLHIQRLSKKLGGLHLALLELSKEYHTNILGLKLGNELIVTVFSYPLIKTVLNSDDYNARPENFFTKLRCLGGIKGVTCTYGEYWNVQKNFLLKNLRLLGFGKESTENLIRAVVNDIKDELNENRDYKIEKLVAPALMSVLWSVIAGCRLNRNDPHLIKLLNLFAQRGKVFDISGGILAQHPWLRYLAPNKTGYRMIQQLNNELAEFFMKAIREHHATWSEENDSDFIYSFITEMKKETAHYSFTDEQLLMLCLDLFIAASKTTSGTLDFAFLMMLQHTDVQAKVQKTLDEGTKKGESINYADRHKFPYVQAVLLEVERYCSFAPIIGPRKAIRETSLEGYVIPKNTTILVHAHAVHTSPEHWINPKIFAPERFLTGSGEVTRPEELLTFSTGKRKCPGDSLAKVFLFIFFAEMLREFTIVQGSERKKVSTEGMFLSANYTAKFVRRS